MNSFLQSASMLINLHGETCTYIKITSGTYDPNTGSITNSESNITLKAYRKHIKATQYNYPNLVGKNAVLVYITSDSLVGAPSINDKITFGTETFTVDSFQQHAALGEVCLYRVVCVKG